jgi:hypothetical protein
MKTKLLSATQLIYSLIKHSDLIISSKVVEGGDLETISKRKIEQSLRLIFITE